MTWFYGWIIVAVCSLTLFVAFGIRLSFAVFFVALIDEFAWPRAATSLIFSASMIVFTLGSTLAGMALDKWGARPVFGCGAGLLAIGLLLSSRIETLSQLTWTYGVIAGSGITVLGLGPQASLISRWFRRQRGRAIGIAFAGTGLGSLILTPGAAYLIRAFGWRWAYVVLAGLVLITIPAIVLFLRLTPNMMGLHPDGEAPAPQWPVGSQNPVKQDGWTIAQVIRSPAFWLIILASLGAIGPLRMVTVHQMAAMVDAGHAQIHAASIIGFAGAVAAVAFIVFGTLSDRIGRRAAYLIGSLFMLSAIVILNNLSQLASGNWLIIYAIMLGLGEGSRSSLVTAVASDLFPGNALGTINGAVGSAFGAGAALFPWLAGRFYDVTGTYAIAFQMAATAVIISTIALWLAPRSMQLRLRQTALSKRGRK